MRNLVGLSLACLALWVMVGVLGAAAFGATYAVDGVKGDDAAAGTAAAPWKTISRGVKDLRPGDVLRIAAGTYRETVAVTCRGTSEAPITIQGAGGRVLVTGADEIKGWKVCTKDDVGGHPDFAKIYWADVDFLPLGLLDGRKDRPFARFPKEGFFSCTAVEADTITDTVNLTQTQDVWARSTIFLRFAFQREDRRVVLSFDPATHTLKLNRPLPAGTKVEAGGPRYYIEGWVPGLAAGQWAYENRGENKYRVYYWPAGGDIAKAVVEIRRRSYGVNLSKAAWVTVDGLEFAWGAAPDRSGEAAIGAMGDPNDPASCAGLVVKNCIAHDHPRFCVFFHGCKKPVLRNSLIYNGGPVSVILSTNTGTLVEECEIGPDTVDGFRDTFGGRGTVVRRNYIHHHFDSAAHPDNVQLHDGVHDITFEDNLILCGGQGFMLSDVDGMTLRNNVILGTGANMIIGRDLVNNVVLERNTCALACSSMLMVGSGTNFRLSGNLMAHSGGALFYAEFPDMKLSSDHNLFWIPPGISPSPWRTPKGSYSSLADLQKNSPLEAHSEFKDPQFKNAPPLISVVQHFKPTDKSTPGRLYVDKPNLFAAGDHVETNFDGVVRTVKAVEDGALVIDPPMERLTVWLFVVNWKDKTDFALDFTTPFKDKYGSTISVSAYLKGDFNGDGKRDVPDRPKD